MRRAAASPTPHPEGSRSVSTTVTTTPWPRCSSACKRTAAGWICWSTTPRHFRRTGQPEAVLGKPLALADVLDVGLRSSYVASWYAAPLLLARDRGLIAFTCSPGSVCYMHGPAYGAQKAGVDKMAADMAVDLRGTGVATVSIWMGILLTEKLRSAFAAHPNGEAALAKTAEHAETPEFTGNLIDALHHDPDLGELSG